MTDKVIDEMYSSRIHTSISIMAYPRQNPTFNQLKAHYAAKGIILNDRFADSLGLLTTDGRYNFLAYLLADENDMSMKVAKYAGTDKCDLLESTEYGYCCLITATNRILERMAAENVTITKITYPRRIESSLNRNPFVRLSSTWSSIMTTQKDIRLSPRFSQTGLS